MARTMKQGALGAARLDVAAVGPEAAVFLEPDETSHRVQRFDFVPRELPLLVAGAACSVLADCASNACCASANDLFPVTCSATDQCDLVPFATEESSRVMAPTSTVSCAARKATVPHLRRLG